MGKIKFSVIDALRELKASGGKSSFVGQAADTYLEGQEEFRKIKVPTVGNFFIPSSCLIGEKRSAITGEAFTNTEPNGFFHTLQSKSVLTKLGAQLITGLIADTVFPFATGAEASWEGEIDEGAENVPTIGSHNPKPIRIGCYVPVSNTVLLQTRNDNALNISIENEIAAAIMAKVELAAINGSGTGEPLGILNTPGIGSVVGGVDGAECQASHLIALEKAVADENGDIGSLGFLTNPSVRSKLKNTLINAGSDKTVWDFNTNDRLMGYNAGVSNNVPSDLTKGAGADLSAIIFGNFEDIKLTQWGGLDILINPFTQMNYNITTFYITTWWNVVIGRPKCFAAFENIITEL